MIDLARYFKVLFNVEQISRERLKQFTEDHIQRLIANNPGGIFTAILTDITNAYTAYFGDLADISVADSVLQGRTIAMDDSRKALNANIVSNEGFISYTFGKNSPTYQEFYPLGLTQYTEATLSEFETYTERYLRILNLHVGPLTAVFIATFSALHTTFMANRTAQLNQKGVAGGERYDIVNSRTLIGTQLTKNVLTLALAYVGDESKALVYFDQSLLETRTSSADTYDINIGTNITIPIVPLTYTLRATTTIHVINSGSVQLTIGCMPDTSTKPVGPGVQVLNPGDEFTGTALDLGFTITNKNLLGYNSDLFINATGEIIVG